MPFKLAPFFVTLRATTLESGAVAAVQVCSSTRHLRLQIVWENTAYLVRGNAHDAVSGGLRLETHNGQLLTHNGIDERGLAWNKMGRG